MYNPPSLDASQARIWLFHAWNQSQEAQTNPLRPKITSLRSKIGSLRSKTSLLTLKINPLYPKISPLRTYVSPPRPVFSPLWPKVCPMRPQICPLKPKIWPLRMDGHEKYHSRVLQDIGSLRPLPCSWSTSSGDHSEQGIRLRWPCDGLLLFRRFWEFKVVEEPLEGDCTWRAKYSLHHINRADKMRSGPYSNNVKQETDQKFPERGAAIDIFVAT